VVIDNSLGSGGNGTFEESKLPDGLMSNRSRDVDNKGGGASAKEQINKSTTRKS
jgi:hypothetical protein